MLTSGDVVDLDLGAPSGREAGFRHPAVVVTAQAILDAAPSVIQIVPVTTTLRAFGSEVVLTADDHNGLREDSAAQCAQIRAVATGRVDAVRGNVGSAALAQVRQVLALIMDID